jgi:hypothetical protein
MILIILAQKHLKIERLYYLIDNQRIEYSFLNFGCLELCLKYIFIISLCHVQMVIFVSDEYYRPERILKLLNLKFYEAEASLNGYLFWTFITLDTLSLVSFLVLMCLSRKYHRHEYNKNFKEFIIFYVSFQAFGTFWMVFNFYNYLMTYLDLKAYENSEEERQSIGLCLSIIFQTFT